MKHGDKFKCPHCGENTFVREKKEFGDDFSIKSTFFLCGSCGKKAEAAPEQKAPSKSSAAAGKLSALLGGETVEKRSFEPQEDDGKVCLHCRHCIRHPFMDRCGITMKVVDVLESCDRFESDGK